MAARGSESKNIITAKLLETFAGSFIYDKNIIIPMVENGENLQIKIALTCAKTNVEVGGDMAVPGAQKEMTPVVGNFNETSNTLVEPTAEEKENVAKLVASLF